MRCPTKNRFASIDPSDDGTLDTVFRCSACGREERYTFDGEGEYADFVVWAKSDATEQHAERY